MRILTTAIAIALASQMTASAAAQQVELGSRNILDVVGKLKPGEYVWAPGLTGDGPALAEELDRFDAPASFRAAVAAAVRPGSVVIVTPASLKAGSPGMSATILEGEKGSP